MYRMTWLRCLPVTGRRMAGSGGIRLIDAATNRTVHGQKYQTMSAALMVVGGGALGHAAATRRAPISGRPI